MNRLSPLIARRAVGPQPAGCGRAAGRAMAAVATLDRPGTEANRGLDDLRLFVTAWLGGLVFFGTFIG